MTQWKVSPRHDAVGHCNAADAGMFESLPDSAGPAMQWRPPRDDAMAQKTKRYGTGLNSLGIRLTLIYVTLSSLCLILVTKPFLEEHSAADMEVHFTFALAGLLVTACAMALMSRLITRPIRELSKVADEIAEGNLDVDVPVDCSCEIGGLAANMNKMVSHLRASTAEIQDLANTDPITGLPNRTRFRTMLERHMAARNPDGSSVPGSVFFIEVMGMRRITDRFGHETGDQLLRNTAQQLVAASRAHGVELSNGNAAHDGALLARFGGTELIMSVPGLVDTTDACALAEKLHDALAGGIEVNGRHFQPRIAIGIARHPEDAQTAIKLKQYAALACNTCSIGKEQRSTRLFTGEMLDVIKSRETMERDLRTAIAEHQFEVYYQPKVSASDWSVTGVEALVRLNHPERGVVGPGEFIPIAEMSGLISDIGLIVLEEAVSQCAEWARSGQLIEVSINVSLEQFQNPDFADVVVAILEKHHCPPHLVIVEITETIANTDMPGVAEHIAALRHAGIRIAIDDFGTGYSNLAQLNGLKFDILKVDRSFVAGIEGEGTSREISRAIIQLGKSLGCRVVVEGTETPGQVSAAAQLGCDEFQGFYFSKPMKRCDFEIWNNRRQTNPVREVLGNIMTSGLGRIVPS